MKAWLGFRHPHTTNEKRHNSRHSPWHRAKRSQANLPDAWDDKSIIGQRSWKKKTKHKKQWQGH